jgi:SOS-response transcriptional repressor LexA
VTLPLTEKQERVWRYIKSCKRSPSYREMERDLGYNIGRLNDVVVTLKEKGFVTYIPKRARSLVALDPQVDLANVPTQDLVAELSRRLAA